MIDKCPESLASGVAVIPLAWAGAGIYPLYL